MRSWQWPLVHLHLNRVARRYLSLKMAPVYYPPETHTHTSFRRKLSRLILSPSTVSCYSLNSRGERECIVYAAIRETYCRPANNERFPRGISTRSLYTLRSAGKFTGRCHTRGNTVHLVAAALSLLRLRRNRSV